MLPKRNKEMTKVPSPSWPLEYCWPSLGFPNFIHGTSETSYQLSLGWPLSYPQLFLPQGWPRFPPCSSWQDSRQRAGAMGSICFSVLPSIAQARGCRQPHRPSFPLLPQLGCGTEPIASRSWLQNPRKRTSWVPEAKTQPEDGLLVLIILCQESLSPAFTTTQDQVRGGEVLGLTKSHMGLEPWVDPPHGSTPGDAVPWHMCTHTRKHTPARTAGPWGCAKAAKQKSPSFRPNQHLPSTVGSARPGRPPSSRLAQALRLP